MKKVVLLIFSALLILASLSSCKEVKIPDASVAADTLFELDIYEDILTQADKDVALVIYGIENEWVSDCCVYFSTTATAEEIAVFTAADKTAADEIYKCLSSRVEGQKALYKTYRPAEVTKLDNCVLLQKGVTVILCVSADSAASQQAADKLFG